jgi:hypothetical protein
MHFYLAYHIYGKYSISKAKIFPRGKKDTLRGAAAEGVEAFDTLFK